MHENLTAKSVAFAHTTPMTIKCILIPLALTVLLCHAKAELVASSYRSDIGKNIYHSVQDLWWGSNGRPFDSTGRIVLEIVAQFLKGEHLTECMTCRVTSVVSHNVQDVILCYKLNHNMFVSHMLIHLHDKLNG